MIEIRNLVKRFNARTVLDGIHLTIDEGEVVFIIGASGTGKSVLLKTLVGLLRADEGEVWLDSENITHFSEDQFFAVRKKCGMVFQQPALFDSLSVYENIAFGLRKQASLNEDEINLRVQESLKQVYLDDIQNKFPGEISFGMQKRVSLARTIALKPKILLFDEPTTGLDPVTTTGINQLIAELSTKLHTTSIVVSHDMKCALAIANRIVVLDQGKILAQGSVQTILQSEIPLVKDFLLEAHS